MDALDELLVGEDQDMLFPFHASIDAVGRQALQPFHLVDVDDHGFAAPKEPYIIQVFQKPCKRTVQPVYICCRVSKKLIVHGLKIQDVPRVDGYGVSVFFAVKLSLFALNGIEDLPDPD